MIAALLVGLMLPQAYDEHSNYELLVLARDLAIEQLGTPPEQQEPLVSRMEELYYVFLERTQETEPQDERLDMGLVILLRRLALTDPELLFEKEQEEWHELFTRALIRTIAPEQVQVAFTVHSLKLRSAFNRREALLLVEEGHGLLTHLAAHPSLPADEPAQADFAAELALASAELFLEESEIHHTLGQFEEALLTLDEAELAHAQAARQGERELELRTAAGDSSQGAWLSRRRRKVAGVEARVLSHQLSAYLALGAKEPARALSGAVLRSARASGDARDMAFAVTLLAELETWSGDIAAAEELYLQAIEAPWFQALEPHYKAVMEQNYAQLGVGVEEPDSERSRRSQRLLQRLVREGHLIPLRAFRAECQLAQLALRAGELDRAQSWLDAATHRLDAFTSSGARENVALDAQLVAAFAAQLTMARRASPKELLDARRQLEHRTDDVLAVWSELEPRAGGLGLYASGIRASSTTTLLDITLASAPTETAAEEALEVLLAPLALGGLSRSLAGSAVPSSVPDFETLRSALLPERGGMLLYMGSTEGSHVFALDHSGVQVARGPKRGDLFERRNQLVQLLKRPPPGGQQRSGEVDAGLSSASRALADVLIPEELRSRVSSWEELVVCVRPALGYVPFEVLLLDDGLLGDLLPISYLASPSLGLRLLEREAARPAFGGRDPQMLLFAGQPGAEADGKAGVPLPWSPELQRSLCDAYDRSATVAGRQGTLERLAAELRDRPPVVAHLVAHGVGERKAETNRVLLLSPDAEHSGHARHEDLRELSAPPLVILSSCGAGRGRPRLGDDGIDDLSGAFLLAGAGAVVMSAHDIHFEATMMLMDVFHEHLAAGESPARALFEARRELACHDRYAHPYFRSLVHVRGLGFRPLFHTSPRRPSERVTEPRER